MIQVQSNNPSANGPVTSHARITRLSAMLLVKQTHVAPGAGSAPATAIRGGLAPWQLRRVTAHIDACLRCTIRLQDLSDISGLSTSHFARAFKASVGQPAHTYIVQRRMERAQELMLTTNQSLCQIALACGLCDQAHFSRQFHRVVGMTPGRWRRQWSASDFETLPDRLRATAVERQQGHLDRAAASMQKLS
jgi:AraC-like DNA-binding protein